MRPDPLLLNVLERRKKSERSDLGLLKKNGDEHTRLNLSSYIAEDWGVR